MVEGRLKLDQWDDKQTGQKRSRLGVILEGFQFLGTGTGNRNEGGSEAPPVKRAASSAPKSESPDAEAPPPPEDDDVPF